MPLRRSEGALNSATQSDDRSRRLRTNPWLWTGVAVIAAGVGVGIAFALRPDVKDDPRPPESTNNTPPGGVLQAVGSW